MLLVLIGATRAELLSAQSTSTAMLTGVVRSPDRQPVSRARVTLSTTGTDVAYETTTSLSGAFVFSIVRPGDYQLRVESLGYRPLLAVGLGLAAGTSRNLTFTLTVDPPPVTQIDTIRVAGVAVQSGGGQPSLRRIGSLEVRETPHRYGDLASIVSSSSWFDDALGSLGLPTDQTLIVADGIPVYAATHPTAFGEALPAPQFNTSSIASAAVVLDGGAMDMPGSLGPVVAIETLAAGATAGVEASGAFSNDAGWSSSRHAFEAPGLTSWQGGVRGDVVTSPSSRLLVAGEALSQETPFPARLDEATAAMFGALDPALVTDLSSPSVERYSRYSSLLRFDAQQGPQGQFFGRLSGSVVKRDFDASGAPTAVGPAALDEESLEFSSAFGVISQVGSNLQADVRMGISGSRRDFTSGSDGPTPARLLSAAAPMGAPAYGGGSSDRLDFNLIPALRIEQESATVTLGASIRLSRHDMEQSGADARSIHFSDPAAVEAGRGLAMEVTAPATRFGTREYGAFARYESRVSDGVTITLGARFDREALGGPGVADYVDWRLASGLSPSEYKDSYNQVGVRGSVVWQPVRGGGTTVMMSGSIRDGDIDPRVVHSLYAQAGDAESMRYLGFGLDWPDASIPSFGATPEIVISMLGPDARAPRNGLATATLLQALTPATTVSVGGTYRRTDFLMRIRDLNLPVTPSALDPHGRPIWGSLSQDGRIIATTDPGSRRFGGFGRVSAFDPSGWSEYMGATLSLTHAGGPVSTTASYTWSETTDNWVGARSGSMEARLLSPLSTDAEAADWSEGVSDFDVTHRASVVATLRKDIVTIGALYRFRSGQPFTPGYRTGVDANGDGSVENDVAPTPDASTLGTLADAWPCLDPSDTFAPRNSCRGPSSHSLNLRLDFDLSGILGRPASIEIDGLDLIETQDGIVDDALLLVNPSGSIVTSPDGNTVTIPTIVNESFGTILYPSSRGRMIRIGMRIGA